MTNATLKTRPDAGNPRGALLCRRWLTLLVGSATALACAAAEPATWYVDDDNYGQSGLDGTKEHPYGTIQDAVNRASHGDTIKVAPGLYNQDYTDSKTGSYVSHNRVYISNKSLTIEATSANRADTVIEGASADSTTGLGLAAVRCVHISGDAATNTVLRGFTFRGGRTPSTTDVPNDSAANSAGGVLGVWYVSYTANFPTVIDCDFIDCAATRGGAIRCANAIRCRFLRCFSTKNAAVARNGSYYNCLFAHNTSTAGSQAVLDYFLRAVNCTFVDNELRATKIESEGVGLVYNSYVGFIGGDNGAFTAQSTSSCGTFIYNCVAPSGGVSDTYRALSSGCAFPTDQFQFLSPATEDFRPLASAESTMAIADATAYRDLFPAGFADEADKDLDGQPRFDADGTLRVGALQTPATPGSGFLRLTDSATGTNAESVVVNSHTSIVLRTEKSVATYLATPTWPATVQLEYVLPAEQEDDYELFGVRQVVNDSAVDYKFPRIGESQVVAMLPPSGTNAYMVPYYGVRRHVSPTGIDTTDGGQGLSADKPWKTLQFAVTNAPYCSVVHAAAGDYAEGGKKTSGDVTSRVLIEKMIRLVGDKGAAATRIVGEPDPDTADSATALGCGPNAVRCVRITGGTHACVQGFTLYNGHTTTNNSGVMGQGGGFFVPNYESRSGYLVDSVVTNCAASRGVVFSGTIARCRIVDNDIEKNGNGVTRGATFVSCVLAGNTSIARNANVADLGQDTKAINCTVDCSRNAYSVHNLVDLVNTIVDGGKLAGTVGPRTCAGVIFSPDTERIEAFADRYAEPYFVNKAAGDYRVHVFSRAVTAGTSDYTLADGAWLSVMGDYEGKPFASVPMIGAYQTSVSTRVLVAEKAGEVADGAVVEPEGVTAMADAPITVTVSGTRPCAGIEVNGVFHAGVTSVTIDPTQYAADEPCVVRAVFTKDWYVDAVNGDDANSGWTTNAAMRTLAAVMAKATAGDAVHALPGVYDSGTMVQENPTRNATTIGWGEGAIPSRVVVQTNVALVAEGTVEETVIEGHLGTERSERAKSLSAYETYALGTNAVRCAFLNAGATVRGFTLRNGRVNASQEQDDDGWGAGVRGRDRTAQVVDCVISNCASWRGSAAISATFRRCRILENTTPGNSAAGRYCAYYGCYIAKNKDGGGQYGGIVANIADFVGNTIAADNVNAAGACDARAIASQDDSSTSKFYSNVILQPYTNASWPQATVENASYNFFADGTRFTSDNIASGDNNDFGKTLDVLKIGADGVPEVGSPVVDAGNFDYAMTNRAFEADLNGVPRGRNGNRIDVGAFEQPWLARYAQDLGGRRLEVTDADLAVVENADQKVEIPSGRVSLAWRPVRSGNGDARVALRVMGNGTLKVFRNGELDRTFAYAASDQEYVFAAEGGETYALDFTYEPGENDTGAAILLSAKADQGAVIIVR